VQNRVILQKVTADQLIKKLPCLLWNPKIHYYVEKTPTMGPYPEQKKQTHILKPISFRSLSILCSYLYLGLPNSLFPSSLPTKMMYAFLTSFMCDRCPIHILYFIANITF
jgi:hypothetical protein